MKVRIKLKRSLIGKRPVQRKTIKALGLKRIGHTVTKEKSPVIDGMVKVVSHMVEVEEIK